MLWQYLLIQFVLFWDNNSNVKADIHHLHPLNKNLKRLITREPPLEFVGNKRIVEEVTEHWIEQKIDHFANNSNDNKNKTWLMRYMQNSAYFQSGGPIFIFVGGEWTISKIYLQTGLMHDMGQQHGAMLFYTEHRFYGRSWPTANASVENLQYLSVRQSLADLAYFIAYQRSHIDGLNNSKVILVGGSYSGSMVAWFEHIYPDTICAAWASSAPTRAKLDFFEYMQLTSEAIETEGSMKCHNHLTEGMLGIDRILRSENSSHQLLQHLQVCKNFNVTRSMDMATLFNSIGNYFAGIVQSYSQDIGEVCKHLIAIDENPTTALIEYLARAFSRTDEHDSIEENCYDFTFEAMQELFMEIQRDDTGYRPWLYQTCNEFGWYPTMDQPTPSTSTFDPTRRLFSFGVPLEYYQRLCQAVFGSHITLTSMTASVAAINEQFVAESNDYNGNENNDNDNDNVEVTPNVYRNVFFTHGSLDPWRAVGQSSGESNIIIIPGYSHTADLGSINFLDSVAMNVAKLKVAAFLNRRLWQQ